MMNPETEALFQKWLKMEIRKSRWAIISKILMIVILILGLYLSAKVVEPIISRQLTILNALQSTFLENSGSKKSLEMMIQEMAPQQKQQLEMILGQ